MSATMSNKMQYASLKCALHVSCNIILFVCLDGCLIACMLDYLVLFVYLSGTNTTHSRGGLFCTRTVSNNHISYTSNAS